MANRLKTEATEEASPKRKGLEKSLKIPASEQDYMLFRNFLADERTYAYLVCRCSGLHFSIDSFVSNLFTWKDDQAIAGCKFHGIIQSVIFRWKTG